MINTRELDEIIDDAADDLRHFTGARLLITGGTGFVGRWLLASIQHANLRLGTTIRATLLTRDAEAFRRRAPSIAGDTAVSLIEGDVLDLPKFDGAFDGVVHAATSTSTSLEFEHALCLFDTVAAGTRATLDLATRWGAVPFLFTSSGAVYGKAPLGMDRIPETFVGGPDPLDVRSVYLEGKRVAEMFCARYSESFALQVKIARMFAFVGPYLPVDVHFAAGNFIRDALGGGPIVVQGDGTPLRSYMYSTDMIVWLWAVFARGRTGRPYNVGAERAVSIGALARFVRDAVGTGDVDVRSRARPGAVPEVYVPSTQRAREELGVAERVTLESAIGRTLSWHRDGAS